MSSLCTTQPCVQMSSQLLANLAPSSAQIDPCTDFDQFVCHGAQKTYGEDGGPTKSMSEDIYKTLKKIVDTDYQSAFPDQSTGRDLFVSLQKEYTACMDVEAIKSRGDAPTKAIVEEIWRKYPTYDRNATVNIHRGIRASHELGDALLYLKQMGVDVFGDAFVDMDFFDPVKLSLHLQPPLPEGYDGFLGTSRDIFWKPESVAKVLRTFSSKPITEQKAAILGAAVAKLRTELKAAQPVETSRETIIPPKRMTPLELAQLAPALGLDKVVQGLVPDPTRLGHVLVEAPEYFRNMSSIVSGKSREVVQAFLIAQVALYSTGINLLKDSETPENSTVAAKSSEPEERFKTCLNYVSLGGMVWVLAHHFNKESFSKESKIQGDAMMSAIRQQFLDSLENIDWMSADAKQQAARKVQLLVQNIGYPTSNPNLDDINDIAAYYKDVIVTNNHFENAIAFKRWRMQRSFGLVGTVMDKHSFGNSPSYFVNARFSPDINSIDIFAGIMQFPFFSPSVPSYVNFARVGSIMGHELTHGFDDRGHQYDITGRVSPWWDNKTIDDFTDRVECFEKQYSAYTVLTPDGVQNINGTRSLGENIADAGGLHLAFETWKKQRPADEQSLPDLERFTPEQLFFIAYASNWCSAPSRKTVKKIIDEDVHAPDSVRIKGSTDNSEGFRKAFNCPVKKPTCQLW